MSRKPNPLQIETIQTIQRVVAGWSPTNDLYSPTHYGDIIAEVASIDELSETHSDQLEALLSDVFQLVQELKEV